ncbi:hypothetical protein RB597_005609 [Gaeumannomyces tritici]
MSSPGIADIEARRARLHTGPEDAVQYRYDVRDVHDADFLSVYFRFALDQKVSRLAVEFLETGGPKQRVVFLLELSPRRSRFAAARLRMDPPDDEQTTRRGQGTCRVTLHTAFSLLPRTNAAFTFPLVQDDLQLFDVISMLKGTYRHASHLGQNAMLNLHSDLTAFNFLNVNGDHDWDGCRDWVAQAFFRFYHAGWVFWTVQDSLNPPSTTSTGSVNSMARLLVPREGAAPIEWGEGACFHHVIGLSIEKPVLAEETPDWATTYYSDVPLATGEFLDRQHRHQGAVMLQDGTHTGLPYPWIRRGRRRAHRWENVCIS